MIEEELTAYDLACEIGELFLMLVLERWMVLRQKKSYRLFFAFSFVWPLNKNLSS